MPIHAEIAIRPEDSDAVVRAQHHYHPPPVKRRRTVREEQRRSSRACLECRLAKTKCLVQDDKDACERCERFSFDCKFVRHHRGRKPVSKLAGLSASASGSAGGSALLDGSASDDSSDQGPDAGLRPDALPGKATSSDPVPAQPRTPVHRSVSPQTSKRSDRGTHPAQRTATLLTAGKQRQRDSPTELDVAARRRIWEMLASKIAQRGSTYMFVNKGELDHDPNAAGPSKPAETTSVVAAGQDHSSTFRHLLQPVDTRASGSSGSQRPEATQAVRFPRLPDTISLVGIKDPCEGGIVTLSAAKRLFDYFFTNLNPWAMVFDPALVSHESIRTSSAFLYTATLYLASRYIELSPESGWYSSSSDPSSGSDAITANTSARLGSHARSLAVQAFALGDRSMETAIAFYISSVWKEADDHFSALYCSYAGKIMSDLPSSLLSSPSDPLVLSKPPGSGRASAVSETGLRMRRHQQRIFLFHYIQEHALLLHFAPRPNFDRGPALLRNLLAWADDVLNTEDDCLLCADIDHLLLQTKYKSAMEQAQTRERDTSHGGSECFLLFQSFLDEIEDWHSKWEWQARKVDEKFHPKPKDSSEASEGSVPKAFEASIPLSARLELFKIFKNSTVMQISSIAFRASLRDLNKVQSRTTDGLAGPILDKGGRPSSSTTGAGTGAGAGSSGGGAGGAGGSLMDDRTEQIYNACLESALNLLYHTIQMPLNTLRHAQDLIMVLTPHAALLATYLISLPLPHVPSPSASAPAGTGDDAPPSLGRNKGRSRLLRRKEYERRCLDLLRGTRDHFRNACVREDDHVALCWQYIDSLLVVIEGPTSGKGQRDLDVADASAAKGSVPRLARNGSQNGIDEEGTRHSSLSHPRPHQRRRSRSQQQSPLRHQQDALPATAGYTLEADKPKPAATGSTLNLDDVAAQTLLNLHTDAAPGTPTSSPPPPAMVGIPPPPIFAGSFGPLPDGNSPYPIAATVGHHYTAANGSGGGGGGGGGGTPSFASRSLATDGVPRPHPFSPDTNGAPGLETFSPSSGVGPQQVQTPVDWTWLQSFLELPEFSWM